MGNPQELLKQTAKLFCKKLNLTDAKITLEDSTTIGIDFRLPEFQDMSHLEATDDLNAITEHLLEKIQKGNLEATALTVASEVGDKGYCSITLHYDESLKLSLVPITLTSLKQARELARSGALRSGAIINLTLCYERDSPYNEQYNHIRCTTSQDSDLMIGWMGTTTSELYKALKAGKRIDVQAKVDYLSLDNATIFIHHIQPRVATPPKSVIKNNQLTKEKVVFLGYSQDKKDILFTSYFDIKYRFLWRPSSTSALAAQLKTTPTGRCLTINANIIAKDATTHTYRLKNVRLIR